jgi:outer membrane protein OmpA-like peptidoglycan-associated protein/tetratricopeptide (TPR) repeat protein
MKRYLLVCGWALILLIAPRVGYAQPGLYEKANMMYKSMGYLDAIPVYEQVLRDDPGNPAALIELADCYRLTKNFGKAAETYAKVVQLKDVQPIHKLYYAQALMATGQPGVALTYFEQYKVDARGKSGEKSAKDMDKFNRFSGNYNIVKAPINSDYNDFAPAIWKDTIIFASSRARAQWVSYDNAWSGSKYSCLYMSRNVGDTFYQPVRFSENIRNRYNNGPVCFNNDGKSFYLTSNNFKYNVDNATYDFDVRGTDGAVKLKIFQVDFSNAKRRFEYIKEFPFNSDQYSCAHAAISTDGNKLYFSSDMPGGYGGMDLWVSNKVDNVWQTPRNMGKKVNSSGNEVFPFISARNILYFSSDGLEGVGALDIYFVPLGDNGMVAGPVINMGIPVNSPADDFGLVLKSDCKSGYYTTNWYSSRHDDDIYRVTFTPFPVVTISGVTSDKKTGKILPDTKVTLLSGEGDTITSTLSDSTGIYSFNVDNDKNYTLLFQKKDYLDGTVNVSTKEVKDGDEVLVNYTLEKKTNLQLRLNIADGKSKLPLKDAQLVLEDRYTGRKQNISPSDNGEYILPLPNKVVGDSLHYTIYVVKDGFFTKPYDWKYFIDKSAEITINQEMSPRDSIIIFFPYNSADIPKESYHDLDSVIMLMKYNPDVVLEFTSHADCRGTDVANMKLSDRRAKSIENYVIEYGGISKARIFGRGVGESDPLVKCNCEPTKWGYRPCTEADHKMNRATVFVAIKKK